MLKRIKKSFPALGTVNAITVIYEELVENQVIEVINEIKEMVLRLNHLFSVFEEDSDISRINAAAGKSMIPVDPETYSIVKKAVAYSQATNQTFDITTRPLSKLWGIGKKGNYIPSDEDIAKALKLVDYKNILFEDKLMKIGLRDFGQEIDLGSIAKGYAADKAHNILVENNIQNAVINFGGSVILLGPERKVGIQHPNQSTGTPMGVVLLQNQCIVTSGCNERYFIKEGIRYHHIMDPRTGKPADMGIQSISLIGDSAMELDVLTTAIFVSGITEGSQILAKYNLEGVFVSKENEVMITKELQDKFSFIQEKEYIEYETMANKY